MSYILWPDQDMQYPPVCGCDLLANLRRGFRLQPREVGPDRICRSRNKR